MKNNFLNKIYALLTALTIAMTMLPAAVSAVKDEKTVTLEFASAFSDSGAFKISLGYSDSMFFTPSGEYNYSLSKLSSVTAASMYDKERAEKGLDALGFSDIEDMGSYTRSDSLPENDNDHSSYLFARKTISGSKGKYTLVSVSVRGTSGNKEWYSNFNVGKENSSDGDRHAGFSAAAYEAEKDLLDYIKKIKADPEKTIFWVTGHSRGAAVGNLIAADLINSAYGDGETGGFGKNKPVADAGNVFAYLYAVPNVVVDHKGEYACRDINDSSSRYSGIYNFADPADFVPMLPLSRWGYARYGKTLVFPSELTLTGDEYEKYLKEANEVQQELFGMTYDFPVKTSSGTEAFRYLSSKITGVSDYYEKEFGSILSKNKITAYEYFNEGIAAVFSGNRTNGIKKILSAPAVPFGRVTTYFVSGTAGTGLVLSHTPETYITGAFMFSDTRMLENHSYRLITVTGAANLALTDSKGGLSGNTIGAKENAFSENIGIYSDTGNGDKRVYLPADGKYSLLISVTGDSDIKITAEMCDEGTPYTEKLFSPGVFKSKAGDVMTVTADGAKFSIEEKPEDTDTDNFEPTGAELSEYTETTAEDTDMEPDIFDEAHHDLTQAAEEEKIEFIETYGMTAEETALPESLTQTSDETTAAESVPETSNETTAAESVTQTKEETTAAESVTQTKEETTAAESAPKTAEATAFPETSFPAAQETAAEMTQANNDTAPPLIFIIGGAGTLLIVFTIIFIIIKKHE